MWLTSTVNTKLEVFGAHILGSEFYFHRLMHLIRAQRLATQNLAIKC